MRTHDPGGQRSPLSVPVFRALWLATLLSNVGGTIQSVAAAWAMTDLSGSSTLVALVQASASLPVMLLALWAGAVADAFDRRLVMLASQLFMFAASVVLAALTWAGALTPAALLALTFLIGAGTAVNWPAMQVSLAEIVPAPSLSSAVALNGMGVNLARSLGPAIGGAILAVAGAAAAFLLNALSYIPLVATLIGWRHVPPPTGLGRERIGPAMLAGLRYGALSPALRDVALRSAAFGLAAGAVPALMPIVARALLGGGPLVFGAILAAFGAGAVGGALASARLRTIWSTERVVRRFCLLFAAGAAVAAASGSVSVTMLAMAMCGAAWLIVLTTFNVTTQLSSPRWVIARALSLYQTATYGGMAAGSWLFGLLAERRGCGEALFAVALAALIVAAIGLWRPLRGDRPDVAPRGDWSVPDVAVPIQLRSGPIVVTVEHRVRAEDATAFLAAMAERSRILRRDGARDWDLEQDLEDPEGWVERYRLPTWLDYVLLNQRRTRADLANREAVASLQVSGTDLLVRRRIQRRPGSAVPASAASEPLAAAGAPLAP